MKKSGYTKARNNFYTWSGKMFFDLICLSVILYLVFYAVDRDPLSVYRLRFIISVSVVAMFYVHAITYKNFLDAKTKYDFYKSVMKAYEFNLENYEDVIECINQHEYKSQEYKADVESLMNAWDEETFFTVGEKIYKNISEGVYVDEIQFIYELLESTSYIVKYVDEDFLKKNFLKDKQPK